MEKIFKNLYEGTGEAIENYIGIEDFQENEIGLSIMKSEFIKAIHELKSNIATGIDEM